MDLQSKIAIVTGASSGLGEAFSYKLVNKGVTVYGLARSEDKLQQVYDNLGGSFIPVICDVTDPHKIEHWAKHTFNAGHVPDILINNAGIGLFDDVDRLSLDDWHTMIETNLSGVFYMVRSVVPFMKRKESVCHIINIGSIAGKVGNPRLSGYNASKFGLTGFSESLMKELRYDGIKVTCVYPGSTETHFFEHSKSNTAHSNMLQPADVADLIVYLLETPDNFLVDEIVMRPRNPKPPSS